MLHLLLVALGGAIGSALRHLVNLAALRIAGLTFPWGTIAVNVVGSFVMGLMVEVIARRFGASGELRLFATTGVLGGFTTFSAFSFDALVLWERGAAIHAAAYVVSSVAISLAALFAGLWLARQIG